MVRYLTSVAIIMFFVAMGEMIAYSGEPTGTVLGKVIFKGKPPSPEKVEVTQDREVCTRGFEIPKVEVNNGGLKNAVVKLVGIKNAKALTKFPKAVLDQKGCRYRPHVLLMAPGELTVKNSDGILHNVHLYTKANPPQNRAMPRFKRRIKMTIDKPEIITVRCDAHGWMRSYIVVVEHPFYAVTDTSGDFKIENVPAGEHTVEVWHKMLGKQSGKVTIQPGEEARIELVYASPK